MYWRIVCTVGLVLGLVGVGWANSISLQSSTQIDRAGNGETFDLSNFGGADWVLPGVNEKNAATAISVFGPSGYWMEDNNPNFAYSDGTNPVSAVAENTNYYYSEPQATIVVPAGSGTVDIWMGIVGLEFKTRW